MKRKHITIKNRFYICIFLIVFCFLFISVLLFKGGLAQKEKYVELLEANQSVYDANRMAKEVVSSYYEFYFTLSQEDEEALKKNLILLEEIQQTIEEKINYVYYNREIEDYINMLTTLLENVNEETKKLEESKSEKNYNSYEKIRYIWELIDLRYGQVHYAMQGFNEKQQTIYEHWLGIVYKIILFVCVLALLMTFLMIYWFRMKVLKPITQITEKIMDFRCGEEKQKEGKGTDEILKLSDSIDKMMLRISNQMLVIEEKNKLEKLLKESEIKAMQARINPHFMFNTLNCCAQMAYLENAENTEQMLEAVSDFFRYNLKNFKIFATLGDEIKNINDYIKILNMRFGKRLNISMEYSRGIEKGRIPILILQPLVENCVIHGMSSRIEPENIWIKIDKIEENVIICVKDDGNGMDLQKRVDIQKMIQGEKIEIKSEGIGLENVYGRLYACFGTRLRFQVESEKNCGTIVKIVIPYTEEL